MLHHNYIDTQFGSVQLTTPPVGSTSGHSPGLHAEACGLKIISTQGTHPLARSMNTMQSMHTLSSQPPPYYGQPQGPHQMQYDPTQGQRQSQPQGPHQSQGQHQMQYDPTQGQGQHQMQYGSGSVPRSFDPSIPGLLQQRRTMTCTPDTPSAGDVLYIIAPINNYIRFKRRYELYWKFRTEIERLPNVVLYTVEVAFGDRAFMISDTDNPRHIQLRTADELWHKENSINLAVQRLPADWKYVAWIDGDIQFINENIAIETIHQLQHYKIVQMFQTVCNLGPTGAVYSVYKGFGWQYLQGKPYYKSDNYNFWHPGFAWAATRQAWNEMGGLIDIAILGAGDHHMALALIGRGADSLPGGVTPGYKSRIMDFQERCERNIKRNIGYVDGTIIHFWHGKFKNRRYIERWDILTKNKFDPMTDIRRDWQGLYVLNATDKLGLRDGIRAYFRQRNEDSVDDESL